MKNLLLLLQLIVVVLCIINNHHVVLASSSPSSKHSNHHNHNNQHFSNRLRQLIYAPPTQREKDLFEKYQEDLRVLNGGKLPKDHDELNAPLKHDCIHDQLIKEHEKIKKRIEQEKEEEEEVVFESKQTSPLVGSTSAAAATRPINIILDTTYMDPNNEPQSCSQVGDIVYIGGPNYPSSSKVCSNTTDAPCAWECRAVDVVTQSYQNAIINIVVEKVVTFFEDLLTMNGPPVLTKAVSSYTYPCAQQYIQLDPSWSVTGFNGDLVLFISSHPIPGTTLAYASSCVQHQTTGRPVVTFANLNPSYFSRFVDPSSRQGPDWELYFRVLIHEVTHGLGFSSNLMDYWLDPSTGKKYTNSPLLSRTDTLTTPSGQSYSRDRYFLTTPSVTQFVRNHFNCPSLVGAELENVGGGGTIKSHWKGTPFGEEDMIGYAQVIAPYSNLTLSLLQDTGWYGLNSTGVQQLSEPLIWGKNLGCDFPEGCSPTSWNHPGYWDFGQDEGQIQGTRGCSATRTGKGYLYLAYYTKDLPPEYQHFTDKTKGGGYQFKDLCPYTDVYKSTPQDNIVYCLDTSITPDNTIYEQYSHDSRCFEYTQPEDNNIHLACWNSRCNNGSLEIQYNQDWYTCDIGGKSIQLPGSKNITFHCPNDYYLCGVVPQVQSTLPDKYNIISGASHDSISVIIIFISAIISLIFI